MRCSVLLIAALAIAAVAEKPAKKDAAEEAEELPVAVADMLVTPAPEREMLDAALFQPSTKMPWQKIAGPIVGGVIGAGALAGVIAMSVMKNPTTTPAVFLAASTPPALSAKRAGGSPVLSAKAAAVAPAGAATDDIVSSGMTQSLLLSIACGLVACGVLACCVVGLMNFCSKKKKRTRKEAPMRETPMVLPEDQQPMMGTMLDVPQSAPELNESMYSPVLPALNPGMGYAGGVGIGSIPTMTNVVPMQTMPPPPPPPQYGGGSVFAGAGSQFSVNQSRFSAPSSVYQQAPSSVYQQAPASMYQQAGASIYQQASPLANTVTALPTTAFSNMQAPATFYG